MRNYVKMLFELFARAGSQQLSYKLIATIAKNNILIVVHKRYRILSYESYSALIDVIT